MKKLICIFIVLVAVVQCCFAGNIDDAKGFARNGRLEEYDNLSKKTRNVDKHYRYMLETGLTEDEMAKKEAAQESLYFNADGTPKAGTFATVAEKAELQRKELKEKLAERKAEAEKKAAAQKAEALRLEQERAFKAYGREITKRWLLLLGGYICVAGLLFMWKRKAWVLLAPQRAFLKLLLLSLPLASWMFFGRYMYYIVHYLHDVGFTNTSVSLGLLAGAVLYSVWSFASYKSINAKVKLYKQHLNQAKAWLAQVYSETDTAYYLSYYYHYSDAEVQNMLADIKRQS